MDTVQAVGRRYDTTQQKGNDSPHGADKIDKIYMWFFFNRFCIFVHVITTDYLYYQTYITYDYSEYKWYNISYKHNL